jgi:hypothetical protein
VRLFRALNAYFMRADRLHASQEVPFKHNRCDSRQCVQGPFKAYQPCSCHHASERASEIKGIGERGSLLRAKESRKKHAKIIRRLFCCRRSRTVSLSFLTPARSGS